MIDLSAPTSTAMSALYEGLEAIIRTALAHGYTLEQLTHGYSPQNMRHDIRTADDYILGTVGVVFSMPGDSIHMDFTIMAPWVDEFREHLTLLQKEHAA